MDRVVEVVIDNALLTQAVSDLRNDHEKLENRVGKIEKPVWIGVAFATVGSPILYWLWSNAFGG